MRTNQELPAVHPFSVKRSSISGRPSARNSMISFQIQCAMTNRSADKSYTTCNLLQKMRFRNFCRRRPASRRLLISFRHPYSRCVPVAVAPNIPRLANVTFFEGAIPTGFKITQMTPLFKKIGLHASDP